MNGNPVRDSVCAVLVLLAVALGVTMCIHLAGCATLEGVQKETETNGEKLSACRAEARRSYYTRDAGINAALRAYEDCKARDGGAP